MGMVYGKALGDYTVCLCIKREFCMSMCMEWIMSLLDLTRR